MQSKWLFGNAISSTSDIARDSTAWYLVQSACSAMIQPSGSRWCDVNQPTCNWYTGMTLSPQGAITWNEVEIKTEGEFYNIQNSNLLF
jgi:hypothetical protein